MAETQFDIIVIGGGPGGYVAAIRAAQLGMKAAVVERENLGGICLNWGCIPTKALLRSAEVSHLLHHLDDYGFSAKEVSFDLAKVVKRSRGVASQLSGGVKHLLKKNKVTVIDGHATLLGKGRIKVEKDGTTTVGEFQAKHIIIATGARAREFPNMKADGKLVWTYRHAMVPESMPKSILVIGSGAIGIEFASFYLNMGAKVTVAEMVDRILPAEDEEISAMARKSFEKQGMKIYTGAKVGEFKKGANDVTTTIEANGKSETITVDRVILAVGIVGNVEHIGLENTKVKTEKSHILVNEWLETDEPGVYAIGDVVGAPWLAHKASHEGVICVEHIAGIKEAHPINVNNIPGCTYSHPQVASVGLSEAKAKAAGYEVKVGRFPFIGNGKAIALGEPEGMVKTVFDAKTGELLGAHMIGAEVTELIQGYGIAKTMETTEAELMHTIFPHPTLSEMMHESVLAAYGRAIHY
ncbi:dihydrolipoamide dehydrogenase [Skermanella aerolata]|uniref:Dihydrolipoyl dehydrogenase n=1 Tax=Skermanella aerolata TaxID=393310 RepID=A0A512DX35_9PROT|nr:dihydrolipoyl dehydrogenase [Skermanella aerolata]KJB93573.1 dihydrolipoamide dehydrogenase [Skermanella aerolata KACC 11604]GEO41048.1 dihydrolipoyl dehydrogenase [Skermanella aerolata]